MFAEDKVDKFRKGCRAPKFIGDVYGDGYKGKKCMQNIRFCEDKQGQLWIWSKPETFDDSQSIADYLRDRKPVIINFESTAPDVAKRIVDFISGATYALDGNIQKVGKDIFLCVPSSVTVGRGKHDYNDFNATQLSWGNKAPEGGSTLQQ